MADYSIAPKPRTRKDAQDKGLKKYFSGEPRKNGHLAWRTTINRDCIKCRDARVNAWNEKNKERRSAIREKWRTENKEKERASQRAWNMRNMPAIVEHRKQHYHANKAHLDAITRRWKFENPILQIVYSQNSRARKFGMSGNGLTGADYHNMLLDQSGCCAYCGEAMSNPVIDHIMPFARDGNHDAGNVVLACEPCNNFKDVDRLARFLDFFASKRPGLWTAAVADIEHLLAAPWRETSLAAPYVKRRARSAQFPDR